MFRYNISGSRINYSDRYIVYYRYLFCNFLKLIQVIISLLSE